MSIGVAMIPAPTAPMVRQVRTLSLPASPGRVLSAWGLAQGRPFDNAYCVLSLFEREHGVRITAYNSETLNETELLVPWDTVSATVGHVNSKTPMEVRAPRLRPLCPHRNTLWTQRKRPAFDKLLSRVVLEKGIDGSTQLRLTTLPYARSSRATRNCIH